MRKLRVKHQDEQDVHGFIGRVKIEAEQKKIEKRQVDHQTILNKLMRPSGDLLEAGSKVAWDVCSKVVGGVEQAGRDALLGMEAMDMNVGQMSKSAVTFTVYLGMTF